MSESANTSEPTPSTSTEMMTQPAPAQPQMPGPDRTVFMPPVDIYDSEVGMVLLADVPGVTIESLEIQVQDNRLTLFGRVHAAVPR